MKLGIDLRCLPQDGHPGAGVAHAARSVAQLMCEHGDIDIVLYIPVGARLIAPLHGKTIELIDARRASLVQALKDHPCDVLFVPSGAVPIGLQVPAIPWVHDVDIFSHPEWFPQSWFKRKLTTWMFLRGIRKAPIVFTVSEYTKFELMKLVSYPEEKIVVTGEGGDPALALMDKEKAKERLESKGIKRPFVLMLGTVEPRKNIQFITELWPEAKRQTCPERSRRMPNADLVIAGKDGWKHEPINEAIKRAGAIRLPDVDEDLKRDLLGSAIAVVTPSLSEGFGLVPLEAVQAGTPALVSDRGALKEVVGDWDWVIPLEERKQWIDQIVMLCTDPAKQRGMVEHQKKSISRWSWERTAHIILETILHNAKSASDQG
jgi:glycosyltransferase involved in cell wall biosynthesis